jgi:hypothetical protein
MVPERKFVPIPYHEGMGAVWGKGLVRRRTALRAGAAAAVLLLALPLGGEEPTREMRRHWVFTGRSDQKLYTLTQIIRFDEARNVVRVVVEETGGASLLLTETRSLRDQTLEREIRDVKRKAFVRARTQLPFPAAAPGRADDYASYRGASEASSFTLETDGATASGTAAEWKDPDRGRDLRSELRRSLDPLFLEELERMRGGLIARDELAPFCHELLAFVLHGEACGRVSGKLSPAPADCAFDRSFGYPCSDAQKEKIERAAAEHRTLESY